MMTNLNALIVEKLKQGGVDFVVSVPCKLLKGLIEVLEEDPEVTYLPVTREEEGIGVCTGAFLGGKLPCIVMQNSGLGNSVNALSSLVALYKIPVVLIISHRGTPGEKVYAQFQMSRLTTKLLDLLGIPVYKFKDGGQIGGELAGIAAHARVISHPVAVLLDSQFWSSAHESL